VAAEQTGGRVRAASIIVGALLTVYVLGRNIPLPGVVLEAVFPVDRPQGLLGLLSTSRVSRLSIFALGLIPLYTPMACLEIAKLLFPALARWQIASARNFFRLNDYLRYTALVLAATQGYSVALGISQANNLIADTPGEFVVSVAGTCVGATALLIWLADRISLQGVVNGFWLLWAFTYIIARPAIGVQMLEIARNGGISQGSVLFVGLFVLAAHAAIVVLNFVLIDKPLALNDGESDADKALQARLASMAIIWPPLLAYFVLYLLDSLGGIYASVYPSWLRHGALAHAGLNGALIMLFCYAYSRRWRMNWQNVGDVFSEEGMKNTGAPMPFWLLGLVLIAVCAGGELVDRYFSLPFLSGGTVTVVTVTVVMGIFRSWRSAKPAAPPHASSFG